MVAGGCLEQSEAEGREDRGPGGARRSGGQGEFCFGSAWGGWCEGRGGDLTEPAVRGELGRLSTV